VPHVIAVPGIDSASIRENGFSHDVQSILTQKTVESRTKSIAVTYPVVDEILGLLDGEA